MEKNGEGAECCMCGDQGLSSELFTCKICGIRSQHKYCSSMYPRAESYNNCNWCLTHKDDRKGEIEIVAKSTQTPSHKTAIDHRGVKIKKSKIENLGYKRTIGEQIKKNKVPVGSADRAAPPPLAGRKRVMSDGGGAIKRSRSEEVSNGRNGMMVKPVFRNRVRIRYKLLEEVSS